MAFGRKLAALFRSRKLDKELDEEMRSHLEMRTADLVAAGVPPEEARVRALRAFGNSTFIKEETRGMDSLGWLESFLQDLRYGLRQMLHNPGFALIAVLTLALGIGANTAMFSVLEAVVLRQLPYPQPRQLMALYEGNPAKGFPRFAVSPPNFLDWQAQNHTFSYLAALNRESWTLTGHGEPRRLRTLVATADIFHVYGMEPALGRGFSAEDAQIGHQHVVVLSHSTWRTLFGGDPGVLGRSVMLEGTAYTVIGVMPAAFRWPKPIDIAVPLAFRADIGRQRGAHYLQVVGRLKPGISVAEGRNDIENISRRLAQQYPDNDGGWEAVVLPMREAMVGDVGSALWVLLGAVSLLVLIACANIANLLLARANGRNREIAVRSALGASRGRVMRQLLAESLLLAAMGAAAGLLLARWTLQLVVRMGPKNIPRLDQVSLDGTVMLFAVVSTIATAFLFGLIPAWKAARAELVNSLRQSGVGTGSHDSTRMRAALVTAELALSLMLLTGAGLLVRSFARLAGTDPGFDAANVMTFDLSLPGTRYRDSGSVARLQDSLLQKLQAVPGVTVAALTSCVPMSFNDFSSSFEVVGAPPLKPENQPSMQVRVISPDYFRSLNIPLLRGRTFSDADRLGSPRVLMISQAAARTFFPNQDPIGKYVKFGAQGGYEAIEGMIVGEVADVRDFGLDAPAPPTAFAPIAQAGWGDFSVLVRTAGPSAGIAEALRSGVLSLDRDLPVGDISAMQEVVAATLAPRRFYMLLLSLFSALALVLAGVGIYGVIAYSVSQRAHEIGIRLALGADRRRVLAMIVREAFVLLALGMAIGIAAALALSRVLRGMLVGVSVTDPLTYVAVGLVLAAVALLACVIPARRATRVDPMIALRYE
ncbi:MAG TPA: ABC transporter permease [Terriglobales bacterium]|nr:ABC transporter permease [Terriglobales bacterium]